MSSKNKLLLIFILGTFTCAAAATPIHAEIIKTSKLEQAEKTKVKKEFTLHRDIFSPFKRVIEQNQPTPTRRPPEEIKKPPEEENKVKERDVAGEVKRRITYEGYVMWDGRKLALLMVDAEFFAVGVDDFVKETIRIVNIERKFVTVEVEANLIEINIKEDQANEIQ